MMARIAAIYRYPVKGLSAEPLARVRLAVGDCLPQDRRFAIALGSTRFDPERPQWLPKTRFAMLMRDEKLARLKTRFDAETGVLTIAPPAEFGDGAPLHARLSDPEGRCAAAAFLSEFLGDAVDQPLRILAAPGHAFADARRKPNATTDKYVSLINLASLAALERELAAPLDPLRFRANFYFEDAPAWCELDWIGSQVALGGAQLRVLSAITRCAATEVNPATAERDRDTLGGLQRGFGHTLMGIYAEVAAGGEVALGERLSL